MIIRVYIRMDKGKYFWIQIDSEATLRELKEGMWKETDIWLCWDDDIWIIMLKGYANYQRKLLILIILYFKIRYRVESYNIKQIKV